MGNRIYKFFIKLKTYLKSFFYSLFVKDKTDIKKILEFDYTQFKNSKEASTHISKKVYENNKMLQVKIHIRVDYINFDQLQSTEFEKKEFFIIPYEKVLECINYVIESVLASQPEANTKILHIVVETKAILYKDL